jgi:hypothetical protein
MIVHQTRTPLTSEELEIIFRELVNQWQQETRGISSSTELILHPAYQQIIGMGREVVPLLLRELEQKSGRWFWALQSITRQNPVPLELRGKTQEMIKIWLKWGQKNGYQW